MHLFPLFADLRQRPVLVVGAGEVAARKVALLLAAGAEVTVLAPRSGPAITDLARAGSLHYQAERYASHWLDGRWLVVAATADAALNQRIAADALQRRLFVNVVDDAALSSCHVPAIVDRSPLLVAISSGGSAPMLARWLRQRLEALLDAALGPLAALLQRQRERIREHVPDAATRRGFYTNLLNGPVLAHLRRAQAEQAERALERSLQAQGTAARGSVVLVGAGAGDPGLLTLNALRALNEADVILHDRLVAPEILDLARRDAQRIAVGKEAGHPSIGQDQIHALLLAHVRAGRRVVRLKGGDPFVFGRGGEELEFLRSHGIDYEVVPGITAALACAAYAGIPLTHREHAQSVRLVTAHCRESLDLLDWAALAQERQTLAIYMGVAALASVRERLLAHGRAAATPFALIENGSRPEQRVVTGTLDELPQRARAHNVTSPALLILGEVAAFAPTLHWFGAAPLTPASLTQAWPHAA